MEALRRHSLLILILGAAASLISFVFFDQWAAQLSAASEAQSFRQVARKLTDVAEGGFYLMGAAVVYLSARFWMPRLQVFQERPYIHWNLRRASAFALSNLLVCGVVVHLMKFAFGRQRPHLSATYADGEFAPFNFHWHWHSFPSGHAQVIFVVATLMTMLWPRYRFALWGVAFLIACTRVVLQQHFLSDVFVGAVIGYLGPLWMYQLYWKQRLTGRTYGTAN